MITITLAAQYTILGLLRELLFFVSARKNAPLNVL